jgi:tRNA threonylcarbamoyladenosine biosynthesis protein TsaB
MLVLGIETSTRRGSVALVEGERLLLALEHAEPNAHAEALLPLVKRLFAETGVSKTKVERVAVGTGPGSFTGLRIGIALGEGIALALSIPIVGVCSLEAMARAPEGNEPRVAALDAGRGELFMAAYAPDGTELLAPCAVKKGEAQATLSTNAALANAIVVGEGGVELSREHARGAELDLPHARVVALLGSMRDPVASPPVPIYVRDAGATPQSLPPSPLKEP